MRTTSTPFDRLRASKLLDEAQLARLAPSWDGRLDSLVAAGLLTRYQARQIARGKLSRLRLGPYLLLERLGAGGGGVVYKAHHTLLDRVVALKVLRRHGREAAIAATLSHPNIVSAYDAQRVRGRVVVALEYVEGVDLQRFVEEAGPLPIALVQEVVRQTCHALEYLRRRGLVHRDVKPANLILVPDAGSPQVKLIDLGLTCGPGDDELCGTADYLAPERGHGDPADVRGDLYSLGCTIYHLLTGSVPYPGSDGPGKLLRHRLEEPRPIDHFRDDVPPHLVALVTRLMERDPELRMADPLEVIERLEPPPTPVTRPLPRPRRWAWLLAAVLGLSLGAVARSWDDPVSAPPPAVSRSVVFHHGREVSSLEEALIQGGVIELHGPGPFSLRPVTLTRRVTLRGTGGATLVRAEGEAWEPLLTTTKELTLEGLTIRDSARPPLLCSRRASSLILRRCTLLAGHQAVNLEANDSGTCAAVLEDCIVCVDEADGAALAIWRAESGPSAQVVLTLRGCTIVAGRALACRSLAGPVKVHEVGCRWTLRRTRSSLDGYPSPPDGVLLWQTK